MALSKQSFEEALSRLEQVVFELEQGDLELESALNLFAEGIRLTAFCNRKLEEAEGKIQLLIAEKDNLNLQAWEEGDLG
ncbi:MAG: exodeoxyribonuclease VII small subunit [bacterium]|jgi:exodeoxyribonuclease VII small subunit